MLYQPGLRHRNIAAQVVRPPTFVAPEADTRRSRTVPVKLVSTSKRRSRIKKIDTYADLRMRLAASTTSGDVNATASLSNDWAIGDLVGYEGRVWSVGEVCRRQVDETEACGAILTLRPERSATDPDDAPLGASLSLECEHTQALAAKYAEQAAKAVARADRDIAADAARDSRAARKAEREAAQAAARAEREVRQEAKAARDALERDVRAWVESHAGGRKVGKITPIMRAAYKDYVADLAQIADYVGGKERVK